MKILLIPLFFCVCTIAAAQIKKDLSSRINVSVDAIFDKTVTWRRDFHMNPELGNSETRTASIIAQHLRKLGMEVKEKVGKTGVVGILRGAQPGPCIALRADIDALPIVERTNVPFASKVKSTYNGEEVGVMHACGHDTHTAILMAVAEILSTMKNDIRGTIKFIFQPAEEGPPEGEEGGAPLMIKEGVMNDPKVDVIFGLHIQSRVPVGTIEYKPGAFMASSDWFTIKIKGKGSHGSQPWLGVDPIAISAQIIQGLQHIVSRQSELTKAPVVISVGKIESGVRSNIIPEEATMQGTIRTLDNDMQMEVHKRIRQVAENIAEAGGATATVVIDTKTIVTYNDPELVKKMIPSLAKAANGNVKEREWVTGAEDFSYYGLHAPAFFYYLGGMPKNADKASAPPHHTPDFYVDEEGMRTGIRSFLHLVFDYMNLQK